MKKAGQTDDEINRNLRQFKNLGIAVKRSYKESKFTNFIKFIEKQYECSGLCSPSMFYLTQSVEKGPPKKGCLAPFVDEVAVLLSDLGVAMIISGVGFLLMIGCIVPLCCFKLKDPDEVKPFDTVKEGG